MRAHYLGIGDANPSVLRHRPLWASTNVTKSLLPVTAGCGPDVALLIRDRTGTALYQMIQTRRCPTNGVTVPFPCACPQSLIVARVSSTSGRGTGPTTVPR